jgi:hypothetical protein
LLTVCDSLLHKRFVAVIQSAITITSIDVGNALLSTRVQPTQACDNEMSQGKNKEKHNTKRSPELAVSLSTSHCREKHLERQSCRVLKKLFFNSKRGCKKGMTSSEPSRRFALAAKGAAECKIFAVRWVRHL